MKDEDIDILEFLLMSEFTESFSADQYKFFLRKFQTYYKILNARYHGSLNENKEEKELIKKLQEQILQEKRNHSVDKAIAQNLKKELKKKLSLKERLIGRLIDRFDPDSI